MVHDSVAARPRACQAISVLFCVFLWIPDSHIHTSFVLVPLHPFAPRACAMGPARTGLTLWTCEAAAAGNTEHVHVASHGPLLVQPSVFRLGGGALVINEPLLRQPALRLLRGVPQLAAAVLPEGVCLARALPQPVTVHKRLVRVFTMINPLIILGFLVMVMPNLTGGGGSRDFNYRIPPA